MFLYSEYTSGNSVSAIRVDSIIAIERETNDSGIVVVNKIKFTVATPNGHTEIYWDYGVNESDLEREWDRLERALNWEIG